jgi:hypothetical protein
VNSTRENSANDLDVQGAIAKTIRETRRHDGTLIPVKVIADHLRVPEWKAYQIADGTRHLWAEELPTLVLGTGNHLALSVICRLAGGSFVPLPSAPAALADDYRFASEALLQFGQSMQAYADAIHDGRITDAEADAIKREGHEAISAILALVEHAATKARQRAEVRS